MDITALASLARKYESNGDPATVSNGYGDLGGVSYGLYQLATNTGSVKEFLDFVKDYSNDALANYGRVLSQFKIGSTEFSNLWKDIGNIDPNGFTELQDAYIKSRFYDIAVKKLKNNYFDIDKHSDAMKAVVFSRSVQYGPGNIVDLFEYAVDWKLKYANLSYVDNKYFDDQVIGAIYDYLVDECDKVYYLPHKGYFHSSDDWINGSNSVVKGLRNRFVHEKEDALNMLKEESK